MRNKLFRLMSLVIVVGMVGLLAGCSGSGQKQPQKTAGLGVIDVEKTMLAHPKQQELERLRQQYQALEEQLLLMREQAMQQSASVSAPDGSSAEEQEFNARMSVRQQELQTSFDKKLNAEMVQANERLQAYGDQLEKELQPEMFSLQLKMNTLQNSSTEATQLTGRMDALKKEYQDKMSARQAQLSAEIDQAMLPEKQAVEKELNVYAAQLHQELQARIAAQRNASERVNTLPEGPAAEVQRSLGLKRQEVETLQDFIVNDVRSKAAKVAAEKDLEVLLAGYRVNVTAVDLTSAVIAEIKK
ncbi:MAG TPA: hypothetical protein VN611_16450 [Patescibacteria group bacterium]|nr:hypothetical protein [Patescibacteria group bacterium]